MSDAVLITGSEGFVGRRLAANLSGAGHTVLKLSRSLGADVTTADAFEPFRSAGVDVVVHLAGASFVPASWESPHLFYETNTLGTQRVLDFCRQSGASLVYVSSYVYGPPRYLPIDEAHPVAPSNPYAHSKWLGEELCRFYATAFGVRVAIVRPFNLYGPGQSPRFLIAQIVDQWRTKGRVEIEDPEPKRDYLYVDDFVDACRIVCGLTGDCEAYNVGSGSSVSAIEVVRTLEAVVGRPVERETRNRRRRNEIMDVVCRSRLCEDGLWKPSVSLRDGLSRMLLGP